MAKLAVIHSAESPFRYPNLAWGPGDLYHDHQAQVAPHPCSAWLPALGSLRWSQGGPPDSRTGNNLSSGPEGGQNRLSTSGHHRTGNQP